MHLASASSRLSNTYFLQELLRTPSFCFVFLRTTTLGQCQSFQANSVRPRSPSAARAHLFPTLPPTGLRDPPKLRLGEVEHTWEGSSWDPHLAVPPTPPVKPKAQLQHKALLPSIPSRKVNFQRTPTGLGQSAGAAREGDTKAWPGGWQEDSAGALHSPACPAWAKPPGRPESWGSRRNGHGLRSGSGKAPGRRTVSRARPAPLTCGTHSVARLRGRSRHSATAPKLRHQAARRATPRGRAGKVSLPLWAVTSHGACAKRRPAGRGREVAGQECGGRGWSAAECACVVVASGASR